MISAPLMSKIHSPLNHNWCDSTLVYLPLLSVHSQGLQRNGKKSETRPTELKNAESQRRLTLQKWAMALTAWRRIMTQQIWRDKDKLYWISMHTLESQEPSGKQQTYLTSSPVQYLTKQILQHLSTRTRKPDICIHKHAFMFTNKMPLEAQTHIWTCSMFANATIKYVYLLFITIYSNSHWKQQILESAEHSNVTGSLEVHWLSVPWVIEGLQC